MAALKKVHPDFECIDKYVHISVYYINDSHVSFILFSLFDLCYCFQLSVFISEKCSCVYYFPALWLFIPFICCNKWMNDGVSVGYKGGIYAVVI